MSGYITAVAIEQYTKTAETVFNTGMDFLDKLKSNPKLVADNLRRLQQGDDTAHKESLSRLANERSKMDESLRNLAKASDERISAMRQDNEKAIQAWKNTMGEQQKKYDAEVEKRNKEHAEKMEKLRGESKEARDAAEMNHKIEMEKLKKDHDVEKKKAEEKLEQTKKEGEEKVDKAYNEYQAIQLQRGEELDNFTKEMEKLTLEFQKEKKTIRGNQLEIRKENLNRMLKQIDEQHQQQMNFFCQITRGIQAVATRTHTQNLLKEFENVVEPVSETQKKLKTIECAVDDDELPKVDGVDLNVDSIDNWKSTFGNRVLQFRKYLINVQSLVKPEILKAIRNYIRELEDPMESRQLGQICTFLPRALKEKDYVKIIKYGNTAGDLSTKLKGINNGLDDQLETIHLQIGGASSQAAIKN